MVENNDWPEVETVGMDADVTCEVREVREDYEYYNARAERKELYEWSIKEWKTQLACLAQEEKDCKRVINENTFVVKDPHGNAWNDYLDEDAVDNAIERIKEIEVQKINANFELATWVKALERLEEEGI
tara:strand:+ start:628 stop:1014 length:387 start_codon:yes stop_codon:yes gene_type:complete